MKIKYSENIRMVVLLFALITKTSLAQEEKSCGTTKATEALELSHPELIQQRINYDKAITQAIINKNLYHSTTRSSMVEQKYTIPVVFHIIHTYGAENISDAQILDQMEILNRDYNKLNTDTSDIIPAFKNLAANIKIQFRLAQLDPNGNCTNGIDRIYSHRTDSANDASKLNQWPRDKYLNVWVVKTIALRGAAGYAYYPSDVTGPNFIKDGVLILSTYIGSIGSGTPGRSRALTHEIGHWLSLQHLWGSTNDPGIACGDDLVSDTPITKGHLLVCPYYDHTCTNSTIASKYNFDSVTTSSGISDPTPPPVPIDSGIVLSHFKALGVSANSSLDSIFSYSNWDTGAPDGATEYDSLTGVVNTAKYYEFTIKPVLGRIMTLTGLTFDVQRSNTGARTYAVRSSLDGFTSNLKAIISPVNPDLVVKPDSTFFIKNDTTSAEIGSKILLTDAGFVNDTAAITFRIYGFNAEDAAGTFGINNVALTGMNGVIENLQNYMEYSYCSNMFTIGQKERMRAALESSTAGRNNLWTAANLAATGTNGDVIACAPAPDFYANRTQICAGSSVTFSKNMMGGTATGFSWTFDGGSPATSTSSATTVTVSYPTPGIYPVTLTASNSDGSNSLTKTAYIRVNVVGSDYMGPFSEPFESPDHYFYFWQVENLDAVSNSFGLATSVGYSGSNSVEMHGFGNYANDVDNLISPAYNLNDMTSGTLTFRYAAASSALAAADVTDQLKLYSSVDCGATWLPRKTIPGTSLINNGYHPESFVPADTSEWSLQSYTIPTSLLINNVRFKFEYTTGKASNNVYIDDINIIGTVGINENTLENNSFSLYPNPTDQSTTLSYHLNKKESTKIELIDILGKKIWETTNNQTEGDYSFIISKQELNLNNGIYFIRLSVNSNTITKKLIIQ